MKGVVGAGRIKLVAYYVEREREAASEGNHDHNVARPGGIVYHFGYQQFNDRLRSIIRRYRFSYG